MKRAFVTGGSGFLGKRLIAELVKRSRPITEFMKANVEGTNHVLAAARAPV